MYDILTGPVAWLSFGIFFFGVIARAVMYVRGLDWQMDRVAYREYPKVGLIWALKSIGYWLLPFGSRGWRFYPFFTVIVFVFHVGLLVTPVFLESHVILLREWFGVSYWTISQPVADVLTIGVMVAAFFIVIRRIALPQVRILTTWYDYTVLAIAVAPFLTGFLAAHHIGNYDFWLLAHILTGEIMLVAIPFTKLSHFVLFFMSRAQIGMDYGIKRGGMKGRGIVW